MTFKGNLSFLALLVSSVSFASNLEDRIENAYKRQHATGQIYCTYPGLIQGETEHVLGQYLKTQFSLNEDKFSIQVFKNGNGGVSAEIINDRGISIKGKVKKRNLISFNSSAINLVSKDFLKKLDLNVMNCRFGMFYDVPINITEQKIHINVHPHPQYDFSRFTTNGVQKYNDDKTYTSYLLLDNFSYQASANPNIFLDKTAINTPRNSIFKTPDFDIPQSVEIYAASAGHNFFRFGTNKVEVTYTGGNINYCIANNSLFLIDGFLQYNPQGGDLKIKFDLEAIVAQAKGFIGPRFKDGFHKYNSFIVKKTFSMYPKKKKEFHQDYIDYVLRQKFNFKKAFFHTVNFTYRHGSFLKNHVIPGHGEGQYNIHFEFIEN